MKDFEVIRLPAGQGVQVPENEFYGHLKPVRLWILPHGSVENKSAYMWELSDGQGGTYIASITHKMLVEGLKTANEMDLVSHQ